MSKEYTKDGEWKWKEKVNGLTTFMLILFVIFIQIYFLTYLSEWMGNYIKNNIVGVKGKIQGNVFTFGLCRKYAAFKFFLC